MELVNKDKKYNSDGDLNAAINIHNWGLEKYKNTSGVEEINACGVQIRHRSKPYGFNGAGTINQEAIVL